MPRFQLAFIPLTLAFLLAVVMRPVAAQQPGVEKPVSEQLEASIEAMELAFRMQMAVPDAFDLADETQATLEMYGSEDYAKGCLLARRLIERGV